MTMPYVGAVKSYLMLLPFAIFGIRLSVARVVAALLAAFGIFGIAKLLRQEVSPSAGVASALILAVHPAYVDLNVFDRGDVPVWMAIVGLIGLGVARYVRGPTPRLALLVGVATGVAIWARLNFLWFLIAVATGALLAAGRSVVSSFRHLAAFCWGGLLGVAPLLLYEGLSRVATLRFIRGASLQGASAQHTETALLRAFRAPRLRWAATSNMGWAAGARLGALRDHARGGSPAARLPRATTERESNKRQVGPAGAIALLLYVAILLTSRLSVNQHHLVTVLPLVAVVCVLGFRRLLRRGWFVRPLAVAVGGGYLVLALWWNVAAIRGLHRTGGVGLWSDAIVDVTKYLETSHPHSHVNVLDWGLANNVYLLSAGRLRLQEVFWGATSTGIASGQSWSSIVTAGGTFLALDEHSADLRFSSEAEVGFRAALAASSARYTRTPITDRLGHPYAEVFEVAPATEPR